MLVTIALGAVVATSVMVYLLVRDPTGRLSSRRDIGATAGDIGAAPGGTDGVPSTSVHRVDRPRGTDARLLGRIDRKRFDSPETVAERQRQSHRVVAILDEIMKVENRSERWKLHQELQNLLRKLGHRVSPQVKERLLQMLVTVDRQWRNLIGDAIGSMQGDVGVAKTLIDMLQQRPESRETRHAICSALAKINVPEIKSDLLGMLGEAFEDEHLIVRALGRVAGAGELDRFIGMLDGPLRPVTRHEIEEVLKKKRNVPGVMDDIVERLKEAKDPTSKRSLLTIVALSRDAEHSELVRDIASSETNPLVRGEAYKALGRLGDKESGKFLLKVLTRGDAQDRRRAAQALQGIKDPETVDLFMAEWDVLSGTAKRAAMGAAALLPRPSERQVERALRDGIHDPQILVRTNSIRVLGRGGRDDHVEPLANVLSKSKHPSEWGAAFQSLQKIGTKKAAESAISMLHVVPDKRQRTYYQNLFEKILERHRRR